MAGWARARVPGDLKQLHGPSRPRPLGMNWAMAKRSFSSLQHPPDPTRVQGGGQSSRDATVSHHQLGRPEVTPHPSALNGERRLRPGHGVAWAGAKCRKFAVPQVVLARFLAVKCAGHSGPAGVPKNDEHRQQTNHDEEDTHSRRNAGAPCSRVCILRYLRDKGSGLALHTSTQANRIRGRLVSFPVRCSATIARYSDSTGSPTLRLPRRHFAIGTLRFRAS